MESKKTNTESNDIIPISRAKYELMKKILRTINEAVENLIDLVNHEEAYFDDNELSTLQQSLAQAGRELESVGGERIIEGVFDGEKMIASDGQEYLVPPNYASKSKLVEGDILKLSISRAGNFVYKQIGPVERKRVTGELMQDAVGTWLVVSGKKKWRILPASVTYFKGDAGDEVVLLVPRDATSAWGAVENIIKK